MANEQMRDYWTKAEGWVVHQKLFDAELAPFGDEVARVVGGHTGMRVLDVGCGTGALSAALVAQGADVVGVDISPVMLDSARTRLPTASFVLGDAQSEDLSPYGPFDAIVSRFGVMFFEDPAAAFSSLRRSATPGACLAFVCWRSREENPMFSLGATALLEHMDPPPPAPEPNAPGPTAFADPQRVSAILAQAGWDDIELAPFDAVCDYATDGSDGVEERLTMVLNTGGGRMAQAQLEPLLGTEGWAALLDEVRSDLRRHLVDGSVQFTGATWLVTARNPG